MNVFISSTVFDLIDVRASVERLLRHMGITPILSDSSLSEFDATPSVNSIETCLLNVDRADEFICILDQRYGRSLEPQGFPDMSATHLEYERAKSKGIPTHFFVRDRLEADYAVWNRNRKSADVKLPWVKDKRLLEFLDEHRKLENQSSRSNWLSLFTASTDLCDVIESRLQAKILPGQIIDAIQSNSFPLFVCKLAISELKVDNDRQLQLKVECRNAGKSPAFDVSTKWNNENISHKQPLLPPGEAISPVMILSLKHIAMHSEYAAYIDLSYETAFGVKVIESHKVGCKIVSGPPLTYLSGVTLEDRRFVRSRRPSVKIDDE